MGPKTVPKSEMSGELHTTGGKDMNVSIVLRCPEHSMFIPVRLAQPQNIAGGQQLWEVNSLIARILNKDIDVDDRLSGESRHGSGSYVLNEERLLSQGL